MMMYKDHDDEKKKRARRQRAQLKVAVVVDLVVAVRNAGVLLVWWARRVYGGPGAAQGPGVEDAKIVLL